MGQLYSYPGRFEGKIVGIIHIHGARAILRLFCDRQETKYE